MAKDTRSPMKRRYPSASHHAPLLHSGDSAMMRYCVLLTARREERGHSHNREMLKVTNGYNTNMLPLWCQSWPCVWLNPEPGIRTWSHTSVCQICCESHQRERESCGSYFLWDSEMLLNAAALDCYECLTFLNDKESFTIKKMWQYGYLRNNFHFSL